mmetsp:Transcript_8783/g.14256  ORF Transcript_8783/g.14256 Transcript_8783/m.14256 type:complete len:816 (-) Transcript_8783:53-2500(-)
MGSGGKGKKWRNAGGFNRNYRNDRGQNHNRQKGSKGKGGNRPQRQAHSRDNRKYDEDHGDEDYEENYYDEGEEALDVDVDEVCRSLKRLPDLQKDDQKKEIRSLWYDYFDEDAKFEALLDNFPRGSDERRNLQSAFEDALPCFSAVQRTKISAKLSAEGFELEDMDNSGKQQGGKRQPGRQHSRDDEQSRGGNRKQQNAKLQQRRNTGPVGSREEDWNAGASKGRAGSNRLAARKVISFKEVPWQSKARKVVAAKADEKKKASSGNLQKIGERSKLIAKASAANARKKFGGRNKGKWQDQGKGALKGITGANLIEVKWENPLGVEDDEDDKDAAAKSPSPVRRGPAGRGRSMTAPAWMTTTSDPPPPAITDDSTAEREDAAKEKSGGRGSRNSPPPSIPKENGEKAGDVERDDRQSGRKGKGGRRSRSGGQQRRAVLSARRNSSQDEPDRQDDWNGDKSRNHRDSQKDDSWRSERRWERGGTYQKWKESKESWPTPAVEESESQVAKIATKYTCSRHNVERSFHRLIFSEDNKLVCRPGEPCRLQLSADGDLIDSLECESVAAKDGITVSLKGRRSPPPLAIADSLCVPERKRPKARRSRSPHIGREDHSRPLAGITAKSSFAPPPLPPSDRERDSRSSAAGRPVEPPVAPPPPPAPQRNSHSGNEAAPEGREHREHREREEHHRSREHRDRDHHRNRDRDHHRDRERREPRDREQPERREYAQDREHHSAAPGPPPPAAPLVMPPAAPSGYPAYPQSHVYGMPQPYYGSPAYHSQGHYPPPPQPVAQSQQQQVASGGRDPKGDTRQGSIFDADI